MPLLDRRALSTAAGPSAGKLRPGQAKALLPSSENSGNSAGIAQRMGDWLCVRKIGQGMATDIFQARPITAAANHPADYVLKVVREQGPLVEQAWKALQREATVARELSHPRLSVVFASRFVPPVCYLVLPFLDGQTLGQLLEQVAQSPRTFIGRVATFPLSQSLWIARQMAEALQAMHRRGWLHGDVKPSNIMIARSGEATLFDFGLTKQLDSAECRSAETWEGTIRYAAPESFVPHRQLTAAADIYSLGLILFELLTSSYAWADVPAAEIPQAHALRPLPDIRNFRRDLPAGLMRLVRSMTAKEPLRRPCDEELIDCLVRLEIETLPDGV